MTQGKSKQLLLKLTLVTLMVCIAAGLRLWPLGLLADRLPYITFFPAVMLASVYGGFFAGMYASLLASLLVYFSSLTGHVLIKDVSDWLGFIIFNVNSLFFAFVGEMVQRMHARFINALSKSKRLSNALDNISAFIYMKDKNRCYTYANQTTLDIFQCTAEEIIGKSDAHFFPPTTVAMLYNIDKRVLEQKESTKEEIVITNRGVDRTYWEVKTPLYADETNLLVDGLCGISTDITERKQREDALRESEDRFRSMFDAAAIGMALVNIDGQFIKVNQALCRMVGYSADELLEKSFQNITHPDDLEIDLAFVRQLLEGSLLSYQIEKRYFHKDGRIIWVFLTGSVVHDIQNRIKYFIAQIIDITERKSLQKKLEEQARQDYLTGLNNRRYFLEQGEMEFVRAQRFKTPLSVLMLDIDHFKRVNDGYGHKAGDLVLQELAEILSQTLRTIDIVCRMGGEEFAVLLPQTDLDDAFQIAERIRLLVESTPTRLDSGELIRYTISIGLAKMNEEDSQIDSIVNRADKALYKAKNNGRNRVCQADAE